MLRTMPGFAPMRALALAVLALIAAVAAAPAQTDGGQQSGTPFRPVAVVNGSAITGYDLAERARVMRALGFPAETPEALRRAALDRLIEDRLKLQEAERLGVTASEEELQAGVVELAQNVGAEPDEMLALLSSEGIGQRAVEDMVRADVVWRQVVRTRFSRRIDPGEAEVDAEIAQFADRGGRAYRIAEIGLPMEEADRTPEETRALAERLSRELNQGGDFGQAARQHSRAASAAEGGEIGWVPAAGLPADVAAALEGLEPGDVSRPVEVSGGISLIKILDTRTQPAGEVDAADPELRDRVRSRLANQQGARLAEGLLQELRRDALIEIR